MTEIYFDNSATTKMSDGARRKMMEVIEEHFGNPSSLHARGVDAEHIKEEARKIILASLGIQRGIRGELVFTSGGTEANNMAILGVINAKKRNGNEKILITAGEHSSVEATVSCLEKQGYTVLRVPTRGGELDMDFIRENGKDAVLASFMHVNNETGALYRIKEAFELIKSLSPRCVTHADCVQSYMKVKYTRKSINADLISISAHKVNGAKGVGALYIAPEVIKAKSIVPIVYGGGQEENFRSGTENVYGIAAFGEAVKEHMAELNSEIAKMDDLRQYIIEGISDTEVRPNLPIRHAPHILNITLPGIRSETMLHYLSAKGIYVSSGSACSSHSNKVSSALKAFGLTDNEADSSIRVSLCPENTKDEADVFISALAEGIRALQRK
ncbi:MAG: cysteine desulfurase [Clostridia bacterium]|nr:cysteine desulfurase [Clostridia bacterium]